MVEKTKKYKVANLMIFSAWFYGFCSGSMNIINKLLLNTWSFQFPEVLMSGQLLFVIVSIKALKTFKKVELVDYDAQSAKSCFLLSFFYSSNTFVGKLCLLGMIELDIILNINIIFVINLTFFQTCVYVYIWPYLTSDF